MTRFVLMWLALAACAGGRKDTEPVPPPAPAPAPAPEPVPAAEPAPVQTPAELYASCKDRMEQPEADGECKTDADCAPTGCGGEVCAPAAKKGDVMTTCEDRLCFEVVDTCGCHEGRCTWSLLDHVPENQVPATPGGAAPSNRLPPTGKPPEPAPAPAPGG